MRRAKGAGVAGGDHFAAGTPLSFPYPMGKAKSSELCAQSGKVRQVTWFERYAQQGSRCRHSVEVKVFKWQPKARCKTLKTVGSNQ